MLLSIVLLSILRSLNDDGKVLFKYLSLLSIAGVFVFALYFLKSSLSIDFQDWVTSVLFFIADIAFVGLSLFVFF